MLLVDFCHIINNFLFYCHTTSCVFFKAFFFLLLNFSMYKKKREKSRQIHTILIYFSAHTFHKDNLLQKVPNRYTVQKPTNDQGTNENKSRNLQSRIKAQKERLHKKRTYHLKKKGNKSLGITKCQTDAFFRYLFRC
jgi:hypothetical protein